MKKQHIASLLFLGLLSLCSSAALATSLVDFQAIPLASERTQLVLTFDGPAPTPLGYSIEEPARISLDLMNTTNLLSERYFSLGGGNVRNTVVVSAGDRTRIVVSLTRLVSYTTRIDGNQLVVTLGNNLQTSNTPITPNSPAATDTQPTANTQPTADNLLLSSQTAPIETNQTNRATATDSLTSVDFRRGENGSGQVVLGFSSAQARTNVVERGGKILIEVAGFDVPASLRRRLDVLDFATAVSYINVYRDNKNATIELELAGTYDYLAYQTDNRMIIEVSSVTPEEAEAKLKEQFPYSGQKLSLSFQDIEVRSVLQLIADYVDLNLVASDSINGSITLRLQNVPWDQALDLVLKTKGLDKRQDGNVLLVAPADEIAERELLELQSQRQVEQLAPLVTDFIQINYAKATDILNVIQTGVGGEEPSNNEATGFLSSRGSASVDTRTNTLIVRDTSNSLERIRQAIQIFDIPIRQVLIEARVVAARTSVGKELGIRWGGNVNSGGTYPPIVASGSLDSTSSIGSDLNTSFGNEYVQSYPDALAVNLPANSANASSFAVGIAAFEYALDLELSALESSGSAEVVSQPKIVTSDGKEAFIISGQSIPFPGPDGGTIFRDAGLSLKVTPQITPDSRVIMDLVVTQDQLSVGGAAIDTNSIETQVLVNDGQTLVLGGVYRTENVSSVDKTPLLGDIPILGTLFKRTSSTEEKTELLIFITPRLVRAGLASN